MDNTRNLLSLDFGQYEVIVINDGSKDEILKLYLYAVIDNFGYRQLNTVYKVEAVFGYRKNKSSWGTIKRRKFVADEKAGKAGSGNAGGCQEQAGDPSADTSGRCSLP